MIGGVEPRPEIRRIGFGDLMDALAKGYDDFMTKPSHLVFLAVIYPVFGLIAFTIATGESLLPLLFPLIAGFALVGPIAALGFYELSRRREKGLEVTWRGAMGAIRAESIRGIVILALVLVAIFIAWLATANAIYNDTLGPARPVSVEDFFGKVLFTPEGQRMLVWGNLIGFVYALVVLVITVVSFPMLLDRPVSAFTAVATSFRAFERNPVTLLIWGLIIAVALLVGSAPMFVGLAIIVPILGHATWHLYRKLVVS